MKDHAAFYKQVGERIRKERTTRKVSQEALAMAVGLKRTSISNIEKGRQRLLLHTFYEIADTLKSKPIDLLPPTMTPQLISATSSKTLQMLSAEERAFVVSAAGLQEEKIVVKSRKKG